jgi:hypothetical protein
MFPASTKVTHGISLGNKGSEMLKSVPSICLPGSTEKNTCQTHTVNYDLAMHEGMLANPVRPSSEASIPSHLD